MRADCPKDKLEFKIFFKHCIGSIFHLFPMKDNGGHAHNIAKGNPLPQVVIDSNSIQFNSIQFFIHTIQDIYISVHSRKIK